MKTIIFKKYYLSFSQSITKKLASFYMLSASLLTVAVALVLYFALIHIIEKQEKGFLIGELRTIENILGKEKKSSSLNQALKQEIILEPTTSHNHYAVRLLTKSGRLLMETPGMGKFAQPDQFPLPSENQQFSNFKVLDVDGRHHMLISGYINHDKQILLLQSTLDITDNQKLIHNYQKILLMLLIISLLVSTLLSIFITKNGLRPLKKINTILQQITTDKLDKRLELEDWPSELYDTATGINTMLNRIENAFVKLTQFSSDLAHELRTPINNLICQAEVTLTKERSLEDYYKTLTSNLEEYQRLSRLIDSMLFIAKSNNPNQALKLEAIEVKTVIDSIIEYFELLATEKNITISSTGKNPFIQADLLLFKRAVSNLILNGINYSKHQGKIIIKISDGESQVAIKIFDSGIGIPAKDLPHVFERFYRVDPSRSRNQGGSGLGLAIVKSIIELHNGKIKIKSRTNRGTVVTLLLPKQKITKM